ncbi:MAG: glycosyltransferase [Cyanobacteria bacterium J06635_13]
MFKLLRQRLVKFLVGGGIAAAFNLLLIFVFIEWLGWETPLLKNLANIMAIELSLIFSFFVYRIWVWPGGKWRFKTLLFKQLPLYHLAAGVAVLLRAAVIFPLLDRWGVDYLINTIIGVAIGAVLNYLISDRLVFKDREELHYPEGLEGFEASDSAYSNTRSDATPIKLFSLVIPAYNEEGSIAKTIESLCQTLAAADINYEILVINDSSRDRTEEILQHINTYNQRVRYLNSYYPNGFGFAVRCGMENFLGDAVAIVMADNSDSPDDVIRYYHKLQEGYECVFGSRFVKGGRVIDYPIHKLTINRLANLFIKVLFGIKYNDTTNAFKAYRRNAVQGIFPLISHHFNLKVEMPLKAIVRGYSYTTIPITWRNRQTGVSKLKIKEMGSRYLFITLYLYLEKMLSRGDYVRGGYVTRERRVAVQSNK